MNKQEVLENRIKELEKMESLTNVLFDISKSVNITQNLDQLFQSIHKSLDSIINTDNFYIAIYDELSDRISYPYFIDEQDKPYRSFKITNSLSCCAYVIKRGKSLFRTEEVLKEMQNNGTIEPVGSLARIWLGIPLISKKKVVGVLVVQSYTNPDLYNRNDIKLLEFVSEHIATVIELKKSDEEKKNLLHNLGKRVKELRCLVELSKLIEKPGNSINDVFHGAKELIPPSWQYPEVACTRITLDGKRYETNNFKQTKWKQSTDIIVHEKAIGTIEVHYLKKMPEHDEGPFLKEERDLINILAERLGGVVERIQEENIRIVLHGINKALATTPTLYELLEKIHSEIQSVMDAKSFYTALYDKSNNYYTYPYYLDENEDWDVSKPEKIENGLTDYVRKHNIPLLLNKKKFQEMLDSGKSILIGADAESWMGVPLVHEKEVIGVVVIQSYTDPNAYTENDLNFLTLVSGQLTMAIIRKKAEEALRTSERSYSDIFNSSNDGIIIHDMKTGAILDVNERMCEMFGYTYKEALKTTIGDLSQGEPPYTQNEGEKRIREATEKGVMNFEWLCKKKNGEIFWIDVSLKRVMINGKDCIIAVNRDITERRYLEEQLQIRQRMDSLGTLAGGIAHDFNNILVGIMGNINMLDMFNENLSYEQKEYLKDADLSCERAANLIRQFQTLSKGAVTEKYAVDIYNISKEVFNLINKTTDRLISKEIKFKKDCFYVNGDPGELHQVLLNLATNSAQAIDERGAKDGDYIRIKAEDYEVTTRDKTGLSEGEYIHISLKDSGVGMSDEVIKKAFDPMFTTKVLGAKKGQGLGLAMVYNIVTRIYKGHININSRKGKGTTIHIYLPKIHHSVEAEARTAVRMKGGSETILVVDDELIVTKLAKKLLTNLGYNVITANDGKEALRIYNNKSITVNVVILDLSMPQMSGQQVFKKMYEINPEVKIIISSGHDDEYSKEGILAHARGNVGKPYKIADLADAVRTVLDS